MLSANQLISLRLIQKKYHFLGKKKIKFEKIMYECMFADKTDDPSA